MAKGLLLGNGINARLGIKGLSVECIARKFIKNVSAYSIIFKNIFGVLIPEDFLKISELSVSELGIETLASFLYKYVKQNKNDFWTDNEEYRLQDLITCICLTSIFYDENGKIGQIYDRSRMPSINGYDYIFTLNYIEFWDDEHKCIHLHGKIDLSKFPDENNIILISEERMNFKEYADAVGFIRRTNNIVGIYPNDIVFAPNDVKKDKLICVAGIYPSDKLYPADDLFLYTTKELYADLDLADELDIFGMSPFGDESIIDKLNSKNHIRVFIYNKDRNEETRVWESKLTCKHELLDSEDMK